jgi:hypothetical protein
MKVRTRSPVFVVCVLAGMVVAGCGGGRIPAVARALRETYSFKPHELTPEEQRAKSGELDKLWSAATKEPNRYLPALRAELGADRQLPFFYYDAGQLLLKLSSTKADRALALNALTRVDVRDISSLDYVKTVHGFARDGLDTSAAAFKIFEDPKFNPYVLAHALELHQDLSLLFMLLPSANEAIGPAVVARYPNEETESAKNALLLAAYNLAPVGDALVRRVAADSHEAPAVREYAQKLAKAMSNIAETDLTNLPKLDDVPKTVAGVLAARRKHAGRISDEARDDLENDTLLLRTWLARDARASR